MSHNEALKLRPQPVDKRGIGSSLIDLGALYGNLGRYDDALTVYKESLHAIGLHLSTT